MSNDKKINTDYFVYDTLGGIASLMFNIINNTGGIENKQRLILFEIEQENNNPINDLPKIETIKFKFSKSENYTSISKRFSKIINHDSGLLISNDVYDLMFSCSCPHRKKIIQFVHDGYNLKLSIQYEKQIDAFVAHNYLFYEMLNQVLFHRREDIFHIPYGIPIRHIERSANTDEPLRLLFLGRLNKDKGVYDLFEIDEFLRKHNLDVHWTIIGKGSEKNQLIEQWAKKKNVGFKNPETNEEVLEIGSKNDIFVFPTKFEGTPVALIEMMSVGCVPIVSNLHEGIRNIVTEKTGILCPIDNIDAFGNAILSLNNDRQNLSTLSSNSIQYIKENHDATIQNVKYHELFYAINSRSDKPKHQSNQVKIGSRLDKPFLPNKLVQIIRDLKKLRK